MNNERSDGYYKRLIKEQSMDQGDGFKEQTMDPGAIEGVIIMFYQGASDG